jgi:hypothetical protein
VRVRRVSIVLSTLLLAGGTTAVVNWVWVRVVLLLALCMLGFSFAGNNR